MIHLLSPKLADLRTNKSYPDIHWSVTRPSPFGRIIPHSVPTGIISQHSIYLVEKCLEKDADCFGEENHELTEGHLEDLRAGSGDFGRSVQASGFRDHQNAEECESFRLLLGPTDLKFHGSSGKT